MTINRVVRIRVDQRRARRQVEELDQSVISVGESARRANANFRRLRNSVIAVAAAFQVRQIAQYSDTFTRVQNQIRRTVNSTQELTERTQQLLQVANNSRSEFLATSELYAQLSLILTVLV